MRRAAIAVAVLVMALAGGSLARATIGTGNENPDLLATASLVSVGADPDVADDGDKVRAELSVTNTTDTELLCHVFMGSDLPSGGDWFDYDKIIKLKPGHTWSKSHSVKTKNLPSGTYTIVIAAVGESSIDPSFATATITVNHG
jgi:hypothetical protein